MRHFIGQLRTDATLRKFCLITVAYYGLVALALYFRLERVRLESTPVVVLLAMLLAAGFLFGAGVAGAMLLSVAQWVVKIGPAWAVLVLSIPCAIYLVTSLDSGRCFP